MIFFLLNNLIVKGKMNTSAFNDHNTSGKYLAGRYNGDVFNVSLHTEDGRPYFHGMYMMEIGVCRCKESELKCALENCFFGTDWNVFCDKMWVLQDQLHCGECRRKQRHEEELRKLLEELQSLKTELRVLQECRRKQRQFLKTEEELRFLEQLLSRVDRADQALTKLESSLP